MTEDGSPDATAEFRPVKSADRTLDVLEALATGPATFAELTSRLGIPKSSLHGLVRTLQERGWVQPTLRGNGFRLGLRALQVGASFIDEDQTVARAGAALDRLATATGETVQLARLDGAHVVYLAKRDSSHPVRLISTIGSRLPAHATALGKALLAARDDAEVATMLDFPLPALTSRTLTEWEALRADLARTRERGYAVDDEEAADGLRCMAVAVPARGTPADAISVSVPTFRLPEQRQQDVAAALLEACSHLQRMFR